MGKRRSVQVSRPAAREFPNVPSTHIIWENMAGRVLAVDLNSDHPNLARKVFPVGYYREYGYPRVADVEHSRDRVTIRDRDTIGRAVSKAWPNGRPNYVDHYGRVIDDHEAATESEAA